MVMPLTPVGRNMEDSWFRGISPDVSVFWNLWILYSSDVPEVLCVPTGGWTPAVVYVAG